MSRFRTGARQMFTTQKQFRSKILLTMKTATSQQTFVGLQDVLKTSSTRLQSNNFRSSKTTWRRLAKTSSIRLGRQKIVMLKTSSRRLEDMSWRLLEGISWRRLQDVSEANKKFTGYLYLTNLNVYLTKSLFHKLYQRNLRQIQNASLRTQ